MSSSAGKPNDSSNRESIAPPTKILVPIDGSENAMRALNLAITLAKTYDAELVILNVIPSPGLMVEAPAGFGFPPTGVSEYYNQQERNANHYVEESLSICKARGVTNVTTELVRADKSIVGEIIDLAANRNVDLIVIGTRGLGGFRKLLLGSVSSGVVTNAQCNVLIVR